MQRDQLGGLGERASGLDRVMEVMVEKKGKLKVHFGKTTKKMFRWNE